MFKKKYLGIIIVVILGLLSCDNDSSEILEQKTSLAKTNKAINLNIDELIEQSKLEGVYHSSQFEVNYEYYYTNQETFDYYSSENIEVKSIIAFENCKTEEKPIGAYLYSNDSKTMYFRLFNSVESFNSGIYSISYIVNDILIDDIMYVRDINFNECPLKIFMLQNEMELTFNLNYNDLHLLSKKEPANSFDLYEQGGCGWTPNCLRMSGNQCKGSHCITITCPRQSFDGYLINEDYPNSVYYITEVFDDPLYYSFRDDFLSKSPITSKYSNLFSVSSDHMIEMLDFKLVGKILKAIHPINNSIKNLLDKNFNGTIVDTKVSDDVNDVLDYSIYKTNSVIYKNVLQEFKTIFNTLKGKNKNEVYDILQISI